MSAYTDDGKSHEWCQGRIVLSALKPVSAARRGRHAALAPSRRAKAEFGPYRQKKTLEASASRVVVEHRGVEPRLAHFIRSVSFAIVVPLHCRSRRSFVQPTSASFSLREQPTGLTLGSVPLHAIRKDCRGKKVQLHSSAQEKTVHKGRSFLVWSIGESNPWPLQCECSALPTVPMPRAQASISQPHRKRKHFLLYTVLVGSRLFSQLGTACTTLLTILTGVIIYW